MGNIGKPLRKITLVPMPEDVPEPERVPEPVREPERAPEREPVPVGELAVRVSGGMITGTVFRS